MGESRQDLLKWINGLLKLNYTKIEEMGTGAAYTQIFDSIYGKTTLPRSNVQPAVPRRRAPAQGQV